MSKQIPSTLIISSLGTTLSKARYSLPERLGPWERLHPEVLRCIGAAALLDYLPAETERVDVLLVSTKATDPRPDEDPAHTCACRSAVAVVQADLAEALGQSRAAAAELRVSSLRSDWETQQSAALVDFIVGMPPRLERHLAGESSWQTAFDSYDHVVVDVGSGLRPLGLGLWLTAAYLSSARRLGGRLVALYAEFYSAQSARWFDAQGKSCPHAAPVRPASGGGDGRLFDLTPQFDSLAAISAVSHLAEGLDFRTAQILIQRLTSSTTSLPADVQAFASAAQLGLDVEAAVWAHVIGISPPDPALIGRAALANSLQIEIAKVAENWQRPEGSPAVSLPTPPLVAGKSPKSAIPKSAWPLDAADLVRHARVVDAYLEHGRLSDASLHAREFCISALQHVVRAQRQQDAQAPLPDSWLDHRQRVRYGDRVMGALAEYAEHAPDLLGARGATSDDLAAANALRDLQSTRNKLAHAGRRKEWIFPGSPASPRGEGASTESGDGQTEDAVGLIHDIRGLWPTLRIPDDLEAARIWLTETGWPARLAPLARPSGKPILAAALPRGRASGALVNALRWAARCWGLDGFDLLLLASEAALSHPAADDLPEQRTDRADHWLRRCLEAVGFPGEPCLQLSWGTEYSKSERKKLRPQLASTRLFLARMGSAAVPPEGEKNSSGDLAQRLLQPIHVRALNARVFATSIAGATAYQTLILQALADEVGKGGALLEPWLISREGGTPSPGEDPFDLEGVTLTIDGRPTHRLREELPICK